MPLNRRTPVINYLEKQGNFVCREKVCELADFAV